MRTCLARATKRWRDGAALLGVLAVLVALPAGCVEEKGTPLELMSFKVTLSQGQADGADAPLPYPSGRQCGETACYADGEQQCARGESCIGYCEFSGVECAENTDCGQRETCVKRCATVVLVDVEAFGNDGQHWDYDGPVQLDVTPGFLPPSRAIQEMRGGTMKNVPVYVSAASGRTNIWVEELGYRRRTEYFGGCNDGVDNDGNGLVDLADPGCTDEYDDIEAPTKGVAGISPDIYFSAPDLRSIQWSPAIIHSPLDGQDVTVRTGDLVVTNVTNTGLYLTDVRYNQDPLEDGKPGYFNSIFLYTWSTPEGVVQGDVLCRFSGGVVEFQGNTQLTFPSFEPFYPGVADCAELEERWGLGERDARNELLEKMGLLLTETDEDGKETHRLDLDQLTADVTPQMEPAFEQKEQEDGTFRWRPVAEFRDAIDANSCMLEPHESGMIRLENVEVSTRFVECDQNQNGYIDDGDEFECRNECQEDPLCSELQSFEKYKQWAGLVDGKMKMYINQEMLTEHVPLRINSIGQEDENGRCTLETYWFGDSLFRRYVCPPMRYASIRGNLRQIFLCGKDYKEGGCPLQLLSITPTGDRDVIPDSEE